MVSDYFLICRPSRPEQDYMEEDEMESVDKRKEDHIRWVEEQAERVNNLHLDGEAGTTEDHFRDTKDLPIYRCRTLTEFVTYQTLPSFSNHLNQ